MVVVVVEEVRQLMQNLGRQRLVELCETRKQDQLLGGSCATLVAAVGPSLACPRCDANPESFSKDSSEVQAALDLSPRHLGYQLA